MFLLACSDIADLEAKTDGSWAAHSHFSRLVPIMMFLQHVFQDQLWHNPGRYANFIIDDPLLRESYGFLNYAQLLQADGQSEVYHDNRLDPVELQANERHHCQDVSRTF